MIWDAHARSALLLDLGEKGGYSSCRSDILKQMMPGIAPIPCLIILLLFAGSTQAAESAEDRNHFDNQYYYLKGLRAAFPEEIFDYCVDDFGFEHPQHSRHSLLVNCLSRQKQLRDRIFSRAIYQLGKKSLAQPLYDECLDYYPASSMSVIGKCMDARLELRKRLDNPTIESEIYQRCHRKWRKHSIRAIGNCTIHEANYYLRKGKLHE